ncbi:uncharacterized protein DS421_18g632120 [Arachis hypogaea]|nr:uncharacterized protein DS421_18g632120 [Arachis hypogaea]
MVSSLRRIYKLSSLRNSVCAFLYFICNFFREFRQYSVSAVQFASVLAVQSASVLAVPSALLLRSTRHLKTTLIAPYAPSKDQSLGSSSSAAGIFLRVTTSDALFSTISSGTYPNCGLLTSSIHQLAGAY